MRGFALGGTTGWSRAGRSTFAVALAAIAGTALASCTPDPEIVERSLVVYAPRSCPVDQADAFSVIYGAGDFDGSQSVSSLYLREVGQPLSSLPSATRSLIVDVSLPAQRIDWRGTAEVPQAGPINVLVWPGGETCRLSRNVEKRTEVTLGVFGHHVMVVGGKGDGFVPRTYVGDLTTGIVDSLVLGIGTRRARATITSFKESSDQDPSPALVAGGEDPETQTPIDSAEIYLPSATTPGALGDFVRDRIRLSEPRTKHGAVVLVTGETLLVGGVGQFGAPLSTLEVVDPKTRSYKIDGLKSLSVPRTNPTVLRLASGEILVAGGIDRLGKPVPTLEWFTPDATAKSRRDQDLAPGAERAYVALDSGGALAVIKPSSSDLTNTVWVITADGTLEPGIPIDPEGLDTVRLFAGTDGAPVLWTGRRWLRWEPWFSTFQPIPDAPALRSGEPDPFMERPGPNTPSSTNGDPGLALWLDDLGEAGTYIRGYRFGTRSRFGAVRSPLLVDGTLGLAPDRVAGLPGSSIRFTPGRGLELGPGASAFLTDVTFADVEVDVDVVDGADAPIVVLRQENGRELDVGGGACAFAQNAKQTLHVKRTKKVVTVRADGGDLRTCPAELDDGARVAVGIRGAANTGLTVATNLRVVRR